MASLRKLRWPRQRVLLEGDEIVGVALGVVDQVHLVVVAEQAAQTSDSVVARSDLEFDLKAGAVVLLPRRGVKAHGVNKGPAAADQLLYRLRRFEVMSLRQPPLFGGVLGEQESGRC